jgi:hypothetical protein
MSSKRQQRRSSQLLVQIAIIQQQEPHLFHTANWHYSFQSQKSECNPAKALVQLTDCNNCVGVRIGAAQLGVVCWRQEAEGSARDEQDDVILEEDAHAAELLLAQPGGKDAG